MAILEGRHIALDTETTGIEPGHRIVEVGAVEFQNGLATGKTYRAFVNPERSIDEAALKVHGITPEFLADKPKFAEIADAFLAFLGDDSTIVIHNSEFDLRFLDAEMAILKRRKFSEMYDGRVRDSLAEARRKYPRTPCDLNSLCRKLSVEIGDRKLHGALKDAALLADVYMRMHGADGLAHGFAPAPAPTAARASAAAVVALPVKPALGLGAATDEEKILHAAFIAKLVPVDPKDPKIAIPIWNEAA